MDAFCGCGVWFGSKTFCYKPKRGLAGRFCSPLEMDAQPAFCTVKELKAAVVSGDPARGQALKWTPSMLKLENGETGRPFHMMLLRLDMQLW